MTFDSIIPDSLWAVRYDGEKENAFYQAFDQWSDPIWLRDFFFQNKNDLNEHFKITNAMSKIIDYLNAHQSETPSHWREDAEWRRANRNWLRYSQYIAIRMWSRMDELHMTQASLAQKMECSQQYVSKVLKGKENLSLETISKIESALDIDLVKSALTYVSEFPSFEPEQKSVAEPPLEYGKE